MKYRLSNHAAQEAERRGISREILDAVLASPAQVVAERGGSKAYQSQVDFGEGRMFLLRVIVNDGVEPAVVVTVYRTRNIRKYWR